MNNRRIILYEPQKDDNCEFEVKKQAIDYYKSNYKILKKVDIVERYQIYRPGYALESNKMKINISGDVFTSIKYIELKMLKPLQQKSLCFQAIFPIAQKPFVAYICRFLHSGVPAWPWWIPSSCKGHR